MMMPEDSVFEKSADAAQNNTNIIWVLSSTMSHWARLVIGGIALPLAFPLLVYHLYRSHFKNKVFKSRALQDKIVLITGASSGLGEALAHEFYRAGCKVILAARRKDALERVKNDLMSQHHSVHEPAIVLLDLEELKEIPKKAAEALQVHGRIDILINNGGISSRGEALQTDLEVDLRVMVTNYFGPVALTKALLPSMIEQNSGHVVAISSIQGKIAIPFRSSYAASKHAMQAFFDTLKSELSHTNIHICVVSPGYVQTNLSVNAVTSDGSQYGMMDQTTASGMSPKEAADAILECIVSKSSELVLSGILPKIAILLRVMCPTLYFYLMKNRAARMRKASEYQRSSASAVQSGSTSS